MEGSRARAASTAATGASAVQRCLTAVDYHFPWDGLIGRFKFRGTLPHPIFQQAFGASDLLDTFARVVLAPPSWGTRRDSSSAFAARIIILLGMQP